VTDRAEAEGAAGTRSPPAGARWEHFAHGADIGIRGIGPTLAAAFAQAGLALTAVVTDVTSVRPCASVPITCRAPSVELLLVDWLDAIVFEMATAHMLFGAFDVRLDGTTLAADIRGEPIDRGRHEPAVEVKGATQTALRVAQQPGGLWVAECVVDV